MGGRKACIGRVGTPNDVADAVLFLLRPAARRISGANLVVDEGMSTLGKWLSANRALLIKRRIHGN